MALTFSTTTAPSAPPGSLTVQAGPGPVFRPSTLDAPTGDFQIFITAPAVASSIASAGRSRYERCSQLKASRSSCPGSKEARSTSTGGSTCGKSTELSELVSWMVWRKCGERSRNSCVSAAGIDSVAVRPSKKR